MYVYLHLKYRLAILLFMVLYTTKFFVHIWCVPGLGYGFIYFFLSTQYYITNIFPSL